MSRSASRRQRLALARRLPPQRCPNCEVPLERVLMVASHLRRCAKRLEASMRALAAAQEAVG